MAKVVVGTGYEALALLYRHIQADHGLPGLDSAWADVALPDELRGSADWFFRGDIALGMNLIPFAVTHGWHSLNDLIGGIKATDPHELVTAMLRSPDATPAEHRKRDREVTRALTDEGAGEPLLAALHNERFDVSAAEALLAAPTRAARDLIRLLAEYRAVLAGRDLEGPLTQAATAARALLKKHSLEDAVGQLFPQSRFAGLSNFDSVVLIPSLAITPFLSARLTTGKGALILYPVRAENEPPRADVVAALKALAHPQRLEILRITNRAPVTGHALARTIGLTEATVHHHTSLLRTAGLITSNRDTNRVYFTAVPGSLDTLFESLRRITEDITTRE
jgi:ArsR family transcriptional regulator, arsenate/arsenite/antimonite-responsive transcriptional repressor